MARIVKEFPQPINEYGKLAWSKWFDGNIWELIEGVDYPKGKQRSVRQYAYHQATKQGLSITIQSKPGYLWLQTRSKDKLRKKRKKRVQALKFNVPQIKTKPVTIKTIEDLIKARPGPRQGSKNYASTYPWDEWLKQSKLVLKQGVDFVKTKPENLRINFLYQARRRGIAITTNVKGKTITIEKLAVPSPKGGHLQNGNGQVVKSAMTEVGKSTRIQ